MTRIHLTLEPEFLKGLFMSTDGEVRRQLVEKVIDAQFNGNGHSGRIDKESFCDHRKTLWDSVFCANCLNALYRFLYTKGSVLSVEVHVGELPQLIALIVDDVYDVDPFGILINPVVDIEALCHDFPDSSGVPWFVIDRLYSSGHFRQLSNLLTNRADIGERRVRNEKDIGDIVAQFHKVCRGVRCHDDFVRIHLSETLFEFIENLSERTAFAAE